MKTKVILILSLFTLNNLFSQFEINGQYMSRGEIRHGFQSLAPQNFKPGAFISQRARLGATYKHSLYKLNLSVQDIRTWGSVANSAIDTKGLLSVFEANAELFFNKRFSAKIGRQTIAYDDERIFGSLDWAMQARRHDAALVRYKDSTWSVDAGFAYNQNEDKSKFIQYSVANYKTFQYLWVNKVLGKGNYSFLFLNNGMSYNKLDTVTKITDSTTIYTQTLGLRGEYSNDKFNFLGYFYYQMGKNGVTNIKTSDLSAFNFCAEIGYKPTKSWLFTLGAEMLSGTSQIDTANKVNNSFNPFYGTNHRFNGYMDYFYVGNHTNSVGLLDAYLRISYKMKNWVLSLNSHYFNAAAPVRDMKFPLEYKARDSHLGSEFDFTVLYKYTDNVSIQGGYSQMFGTGTMKALKGGSVSNNSNWAYLMLIIRPNTKMLFPRSGLKM
ncbi:MAG: alginate export family protein [Flavobacteriia bacterium]|nr:alginate export family protein [Flavobacteriia bacterium]